MFKIKGTILSSPDLGIINLDRKLVPLMGTAVYFLFDFGRVVSVFRANYHLNYPLGIIIC